MSGPAWERWLRPVRFGVLLLAASAALSAWWAVHHMPNPDEGAVLTNAMKILDGGVFYREIDAYPYPGSNYAAAAAMAIFGERLAVARALAGLLFCIVVVSLYAAALPLLGSRRAALFGLSLLAFKLLGFPVFTTYTYADFSFAFACLGLPLLLDGRGAGRLLRLFLAGACIAVSFASKQSLGLYLAAAVVAQLAFPRVFARRASPRVPRELGAFAAGFAAVAVPTFGFFASHGVLGAMLYSGFVRPLTSYLALSGIPAGYMLEWWNFGALYPDNTAAVYLPLLPLHLLRSGGFPFEPLYPIWWPLLEFLSRAVYTSLVLAFCVASWRWLRSWRSSEVPPGDARLFVFAQLAFGFLLSAFPRADWGHIVNVYPVVWLLLFALFRPGRTAARIEAGAVGLLVAATGLLALSIHGRMTYPLQLERASVWIEPENAWIEPVIHAIRDRVPEGEPFFVYGQEAHVYFLADRYNDWPFAQLYPGQTGPGGGEAVVALLERDRPRIVYRGLGGWPGSPGLSSYAPALERYVREEFRRLPKLFENNPPPAGEPPQPMVMELRRARRKGEPPRGSRAIR